MPGSVLGTGDKVVNKTNRCPRLQGVFMGVGGEESNRQHREDLGLRIFCYGNMLTHHAERKLEVGGWGCKKGEL